MTVGLGGPVTPEQGTAILGQLDHAALAGAARDALRARHGRLARARDARRVRGPGDPARRSVVARPGCGDPRRRPGLGELSPSRWAGAGARADGSGRPVGPRSPRPRSPPRTSHPPCCGWRGGPSASPGAGLARTWAVSSRVGAQPIIPRSKVTGGSASTTISSSIGSGSRPSTSRNHAAISPRPLGRPTDQPAWSGWKRMSKRPIIGAIIKTSSGADRVAARTRRAAAAGAPPPWSGRRRRAGPGRRTSRAR